MSATAMQLTLDFAGIPDIRKSLNMSPEQLQKQSPDLLLKLQTFAGLGLIVALARAKRDELLPTAVGDVRRTAELRELQQAMHDVLMQSAEPMSFTQLREAVHSRLVLFDDPGSVFSHCLWVLRFTKRAIREPGEELRFSGRQVSHATQ